MSSPSPVALRARFVLVAFVVFSIANTVHAIPPNNASSITDTAQIQESALQQMQLLVERKRSLSKMQQKIGSRLLIARDRAEGTLDPRLSSLRTTVATLDDDHVTPLVDIGFDRDQFMPVLKQLDARPSVRILVALPDGIRIALPFADLESVAAISQVRWIREAARATTNRRPTAPSSGAASPVAGDAPARSTFATRAAAVRTRLAPIVAAASPARTGQERPSIVNVSEGDVAHRAADGRNFYGVNGAGIKVGVLSDGVSSLAAAQASGDLPPSVTVLPGQDGSGDEGTAMLEIVHDLAPGAQLYFASAFGSEPQFAQNILDLRAAGCDVIVDDVFYFNESPFRDGGNTPLTVVANAVQTVTASGALYFSSAGNDGNVDDSTGGVWEGMFVQSTGSIATLAGAGPLHTFGGAANNVFDQCTSSGSGVTVLSWDNPIGTASDDYDVYLMDSTLTTIFDASTDTQDGSGGDDFPVEIAGASFTNDREVVALFSGSARYLRLQAYRGRLALATPGGTSGHSTVAAAFGVAAVDVATATGGAFVGGATNPVESFSSDGPRRLFTQADGTPFPGGFVIRQKPDIAAADGVSTSQPAFNPFFGTSAAAPHAAAIAALVKSSNPSLTPAQIRTALTTSALDIEAAGVDRDSGSGIVMALQALQAAGAAPAASLTVQSSTVAETAGNANGFIDPCERFSVAVTLSNMGGATATGISSTLTSSTPGVTISAGTSAYPNIPSGGSASNSTPFAGSLASTVLCGTVVQLSLTVTYAPGQSPVSLPLSFVVGRPGTPATFSYTGPPVAIPDSPGAEVPGSTASASLPVSGVAGAISSLSLRFDGSSCSPTAGSTTVGLDHTFVGDLVITLRAPSGTTVTVVNRISNGTGGNSGNNICQTLLADSASTPIQSQLAANAPFTGTFAPANPLSAFRGEDPNGTWQLRVTDFFVGDTGNVRAWSLVITPTVCDPVPLTITCPPSVTTAVGAAQCSAIVDYTAPAPASACATVACAPASGSSFPLGVTTVTCTATDGINTPATCSFTVTVNDTTPPTITCPVDVATTATGTQGTVLGATVTYPAPVVSDNCAGVTSACVPASGSFFPVGTSTVTCTATDTSANTGTCSFTVMVSVAFTGCFVDDGTGNVLSIVADRASPVFGFWQLQIAATGQVLSGFAESVSYAPGRSLVAYDHDSHAVRMDVTVSYASHTCTATVKDLAANRTYTIRDRNTANDPPCT